MVLTRFSVRAYPDGPAFSAAWLDYRLDVFEDYCLPSLARQTSPRFSWLVFCDESTDSSCIERLHALRTQAPQLEIVLTSPHTPSYRAALARAAPGTRLLVTTRVDSDDASSVDLIERIQRYVAPFLASGAEVGLLNFCRGLKWRAEDGTLHETWNPHSPHLSMFERLDGAREPVTVQSGNHGLMQERYPLHVDAGPPAWVQVVHGGNVSNRVGSTDREVPTAALDGRFVIRPSGRARQAVPVAQPEAPGERAAFRQALEESLLGRYGRGRPPGA